ncbi:hypothetical protein ABZ858_07605 [Streptomyces sp. NPDC047017]|uniref:hypothetical protein n=1 Tax=Streptomyces sp. NPDC047017 TaxID=3155024 RepID=UPI0033E18376
MPRPHRGPVPPRSRAVPAAALVGCLIGAGALAGCGSGNDQGGGASTPPAPQTPATASFSGMPPSALASAAASAIESARASASAAASSASARASEFEASVDAEAARAGTAAEKELKNVHGRGNATGEVGMTGLPRAQTGGLLAALVTITNKTAGKASYAVQVDFADASGKVVETRYVGAENLAPGKQEQPIAFSRRSPDEKLTPRLAKAQRY